MHMTIEVPDILNTILPINKGISCNHFNINLIFFQTKDPWILFFLVEHYAIKMVIIWYY